MRFGDETIEAMMAYRSRYVMVPEDDPGWVRFWNAFPKRQSKKEARKAWAKLNPNPHQVDEIMFALAWQVPFHRWDGHHFDYCPLPASYLNQERWTDEMPPSMRQKLAEDAVEQAIKAYVPCGKCANGWLEVNRAVQRCACWTAHYGKAVV